MVMTMKGEEELRGVLERANDAYISECTGMNLDESRAYEIRGFMEGIKWVLGDTDIPPYAQEPTHGEE